MTGSKPPGSAFRTWLEGVPAVYLAIGAALTAVLGLFAPDRLMPEPFQNLKPIVSVYIAATLILVWAWRRSLRRGLKWFAGVAFLLAAIFAALNLVFVRPVNYSRGEQTLERFFLTGLDPVHSQDRGQSAEDLIKTYGDGWSDLIAIWGNEIVGIAILYVLTYLALILAMVMSAAASDLVQPRKKT